MIKLARNKSGLPEVCLGLGLGREAEAKHPPPTLLLHRESVAFSPPRGKVQPSLLLPFPELVLLWQGSVEAKMVPGLGPASGALGSCQTCPLKSLTELSTARWRKRRQHVLSSHLPCHRSLLNSHQSDPCHSLCVTRFQGNGLPCKGF